MGIVPDWARLPLTQGRLTSDILDVLLLRRLVQSFQVDHTHLPSANITSRPIRQVMYGLLLGSKTRTRVEEWDREGTQLSEIMVRPIIRGVGQKLKLDLLHQVRYQVFCFVCFYIATGLKARLNVEQSCLMRNFKKRNLNLLPLS